MPSLFISYSRKDTDCARRLTDAFNGQDLDFWIDWEGIPPTVDWWKEVERGIEQAGVFLFLVSPDSIRSRVCRREIDYALRNGKRLIPVVVREVNVEDTPTVLSHLNWIFIRGSDDFEKALDKLITAIKTDYEWVRVHSDLQSKALEWETSKRDKSFLLHGTELQLAEFQLTTNASKDPHPTDLQREYLLKSRQAADRQKKIITSIAVVVAISLITLAAAALFQASRATLHLYSANVANTQVNLEAARANVANTQVNLEAATANAANTQVNLKVATANAANTETSLQRDYARNQAATADSAKATAEANRQIAEQQAEIAFSRQLAAEARSLMTEQFDLALLLAVEASRGTTDGQQILSNLLRAEPHLTQIISSPTGYIWNRGRGDAGFINNLALSPDGERLVAQSYAGARLWDLATRQTYALDPGLSQSYIDAWLPNQITPQELEELLRTVDTATLTAASSVVSNRAALSACRTMPSAGGAPGCESLIYVFDRNFERLITPLEGCSSNTTVPDWIKLNGGSFHVLNQLEMPGLPAEFDLYSVMLANKASNNGSKLIGALYNPQTNRLTTAAAYNRMESDLALIVWDLGDKKPILELFYQLGYAGEAKIDFSNTGTAVDVCAGGKEIQIDISPESWQVQACEIAGRNFTRVEWQQYFPGKEYRKTCDQWPLDTGL